MLLSTFFEKNPKLSIRKLGILNWYFSNFYLEKLNVIY